METDTRGIDLHIHTTKSDGMRTLEETIRDASEAGMGAIAITDHNQFALFYPEKYKNMEIIPGAEFSTTYLTNSGRLLEVHVIGLFFNGVPKEIQHIFKKIPQQRKNYLDAVITRLNHIGISLAYEELLDHFPESNQIGRRHIAELLVKKHYAENINDAFDRLIGNRSPYWVDIMKYLRYMPLQKCVELICMHQGFPILAHPYHYHCSMQEVEDLIDVFLKACAGHPAGMEVYYSKYDQRQREELKKMAEERNLFASAASDRHSSKERFECGDSYLLKLMKEAMK
ncbi:MAG: PHP domain-containing protein [Lachnospiraceae bacterium]